LRRDATQQEGRPALRCLEKQGPWTPTGCSRPSDVPSHAPPTPKLFGKRTAIYARFSSSNQREASIEDQVRVCTDFIAREGGVVREDLIFVDRAISGSSLTRSGFEQMMSQVLARPPRVDAIVCEDLSRIARDLADGAALFKRLQFAGVPLIGIADNIDTANPSSKMSYGLKALMSEAYIDDLRFRTKRRLDGRASRTTRPAVFRSAFAANPFLAATAPSSVTGSSSDEQGKATVTRIFTMYSQGQSLESIARLLNADKVPPPRASTRHRRKGWVASTIRAILRNHAYVGEFAFNRREWRKVRDTNVRRYRSRPDAEVTHRSRPHLRIIDADLWKDVQTRIHAVRQIYVKTEGARPCAALGNRTSYPLSGLLHCGECGVPLTIFGGSSRRYCRCSDNKKRGTCANRLSLREDIARCGLLGFRRENLTGPKEVAFIRKTVAEVLGNRSRKTNAEIAERRQRLASTEERIAGLIQFIADDDRSDYVRVALRDLEAQAKMEKAAIADLEARRSEAVRLPSVEETVERAMMFEKNLLANPTSGREALRHLFEDGKVFCRPQPEGVYLARGQILPSRPLLLAARGRASEGPRP
jgi:site-specific DNA recombinase